MYYEIHFHFLKKILLQRKLMCQNVLFKAITIPNPNKTQYSLYEVVSINTQHFEETANPSGEIIYSETDREFRFCDYAVNTKIQ